MNFIDHSLAWVKGEQFEGLMLALWGAALVGLAFLFWKLGPSATVKALALPFMIVGLLWGVAGGGSMYANSQRIERYTQEHRVDPAAFIQSEDRRVNGFIWVYRYLLMAWSALIALGVLAFMLWGGSIGRAVGLGLILFGVSGLMVDHTSEHNAHKYRAAIDEALHASKK